jgi:hypothetical protein
MLDDRDAVPTADSSSLACSSSRTWTRAASARWASFAHHGNSRCRSSIDIAGLLILPIRLVKFLAVDDPRRNPVRESSDRDRRQPNRLPCKSKWCRPRRAIRPSDREVTASTVRQLEPDHAIAVLPHDHELATKPRMCLERDPDGCLVRRIRGSSRLLFPSSAGRNTRRSDCSRCPALEPDLGSQGSFSQGIAALLAVWANRRFVQGRAAARSAAQRGRHRQQRPVHGIREDSILSSVSIRSTRSRV